MDKNLSRDEAFELFKQYNKTDSLLKHGLAVEGVMRHFARMMGEDEDWWGTVGLLHDIDYEMYPDEHCKKAPQILKEAGCSDTFIHAVVSHGYGLCSDVEPEHIMEKVLFTIDELTGLITAAALMRPSKSVGDLECKSVMKKYKTPSFAAGVNREVIEKGCATLGKELTEVISETILGMREVAEAIGL